MPLYKVVTAQTEYRSAIVEAKNARDARRVYWRESPVTDFEDAQDERIAFVDRVEEPK